MESHFWIQVISSMLPLGCCHWELSRLFGSVEMEMIENRCALSCWMSLHLLPSLKMRAHINSLNGDKSESGKVSLLFCLRSKRDLTQTRRSFRSSLQICPQHFSFSQSLCNCTEESEKNQPQQHPKTQQFCLKGFAKSPTTKK